MTLGASTTAAAAAAAITPLAVAMNLRRSVIALPSSQRNELMVGAFGDVIPRPHQRLGLGEGGVHLPGDGGLLGFLLDDLRRELLESAERRRRELRDLELGLEHRRARLECDRVLGMV